MITSATILSAVAAAAHPRYGRSSASEIIAPAAGSVPAAFSLDQDTRSSGGSYVKQELQDVYAATFQVRPGHQPRVRASARIWHDLRVARRAADRLRTAVLPQLRR